MKFFPVLLVNKKCAKICKKCPHRKSKEISSFNALWGYEQESENFIQTQKRLISDVHILPARISTGSYFMMSACAGLKIRENFLLSCLYQLLEHVMVVMHLWNKPRVYESTNPEIKCTITLVHTKFIKKRINQHRCKSSSNYQHYVMDHSFKVRSRHFCNNCHGVLPSKNLFIFKIHLSSTVWLVCCKSLWNFWFIVLVSVQIINLSC